MCWGSQKTLLSGAHAKMRLRETRPRLRLAVSLPAVNGILSCAKSSARRSPLPRSYPCPYGREDASCRLRLLLHAREVGQQLEPRIGQILLVLDQPLELGQPLQNAMQVRRLRPGIGAAKRAHHGLLVIRLLVLEVDLGVERAGKIGRQVARILRADGDARPERAALAGEVFEMRAAGHAPGFVEHEQARQLARLRAPQQHAVQPDDNKLRQRGLDLVGRQREQRQHQPLVQHGLERHRQLVRFREQPKLEQRRDAVQQADGLRVLRFLLLLQDRDDIVETRRPDAVGVHPFLRIDAAPLERLLHGVAQRGGLAVAKAEHALQDARDGENVLDGLRLPVLAGAGHQRVERDAVAAHVVHLEADGPHEVALGIVVLEVENADREAHVGHALDQHVQRLRLAGARIAGDEDAEVQELCLGLERRPVDLAAVLVAAEHHGVLRGRAASRDRSRRGRGLGFGRFVLVRRGLEVGELHHIGEGHHLGKRARIALPGLKARCILEIAKEMPRGVQALPGQHLDLRHDDGLQFLGVADDRRDEPPRARKPAAARAHDDGPRAVHAAQENPDLLGQRRAAPLVAKRDLAALDALAVLLEVALDDDRASPAAHRAPRLDGG